jgi:succinylglutamic semialdehyde dehydrogenase
MLEHVSYQRMSPVNGIATWSANWADEAEIVRSLEQARVSQRGWSERPLEDRIHLARQFANTLESHRVEIARAITLESGKPLWESHQEVSVAKTKVDNSIDAIRTRRFPWSDQASPLTNTIRFQAIGTVLVLGPYNLPLHLPGAHIVPSLLAGNAVVFKPSEKSPLVGDWIARCWLESGLPEGILQVVHGGIDVAQRLVQEPVLSGVFFTGSYRGGVSLHRALAGRPECLLALEMGGNNPLVIDEVNDMEAAIQVIIQSCYITSGQRCTCARRLIVVDRPDNRRLVERLVTAIGKIRVGCPLSNPEPYMGCLVSPEAANQILDAQQAMLSKGARPLIACKVLSENASLVTPGLLETTTLISDDEEHFGPLTTVTFAHDFDQAMTLANQTKYGLSAGLLSVDAKKFDFFVQSIRAGIVNWNSPTTGASGKLPFGGTGASGNHRPSGYYAADYCSYPKASVEAKSLKKAEKLPPGLEEIGSSA